MSSHKAYHIKKKVSLKIKRKILRHPSGFEPIYLRVQDGRISSNLRIEYEVTFKTKNTTYIINRHSSALGLTEQSMAPLYKGC